MGVRSFRQRDIPHIQLRETIRSPTMSNRRWPDPRPQQPVNAGLEIGRRLRVKGYFAKIQDTIWGFRWWPAWAQSASLSREKRLPSLKRLFHYFWANGLTASKCGEWVRLLDFQHGKRMFNNDPQVVEYVNSMVQEAISNSDGFADDDLYDVRHVDPRDEKDQPAPKRGDMRSGREYWRHEPPVMDDEQYNKRANNNSLGSGRSIWDTTWNP